MHLFSPSTCPFLICLSSNLHSFFKTMSLKPFLVLPRPQPGKGGRCILFSWLFSVLDNKLFEMSFFFLSACEVSATPSHPCQPRIELTLPDSHPHCQAWLGKYTQSYDKYLTTNLQRALHKLLHGPLTLLCYRTGSCPSLCLQISHCTCTQLMTMPPISPRKLRQSEEIYASFTLILHLSPCPCSIVLGDTVPDTGTLPVYHGPPLPVRPGAPPATLLPVFILHLPAAGIPLLYF